MTGKTSDHARKKKKPTDWAALAGKRASAPKEEIEREEAVQSPATAGNLAVRVTASGKVVPVTKPQTFRLPIDVLAILAEEKAVEAALGNKLTNDAAVTEALRQWGKARNRQRRRAAQAADAE